MVVFLGSQIKPFHCLPLFVNLTRVFGKIVGCVAALVYPPDLRSGQLYCRVIEQGTLSSAVIPRRVGPAWSVVGGAVSDTSFFLPGLWFPRLWSEVACVCKIPGSSPLRYFLVLWFQQRNTRHSSRGALSVNAKDGDHSLDFEHSAAHLSADRGLLMTQAIIPDFSCGCFVRICPPARKCGSSAPQRRRWALPYAARDWDWLMLLWAGNPSQLLRLAGLLKAASAARIFPWVPGPHSRTAGPLPRSPSPPSGLRIVCEFGCLPSALCTGVSSGNSLLDPNCMICGNPLGSRGLICLSCNL